jgi:hypothetical protein
MQLALFTVEGLIYHLPTAAVQQRSAALLAPAGSAPDFDPTKPTLFVKGSSRNTTH